MINKVINLKDYFPMLEKEATLTSFCPSNDKEVDLSRKRKTVLIIPGGGYGFVSFREGEPIAFKLISQDINAFVLNYNVGPYKTFGYPLFEGYAAIAYIREHASEYNVDVNSLSVMGFSAGGHLAASLADHMAETMYADFLKVKQETIKVNGVILAYPVITMDEASHGGTRDMISLGDPKLKEYYSVEKHITKNYPKTFIWLTCTDDCVPAINSLKLANALNAANIQFEMHVYPYGWHGTATADEITYKVDENNQEAIESIGYFKDWINLAIKFVKTML